jgi:hypothetical protein
VNSRRYELRSAAAGKISTSPSRRYFHAWPRTNEESAFERRLTPASGHHCFLAQMMNAMAAIRKTARMIVSADK